LILPYFSSLSITKKQRAVIGWIYANGYTLLIICCYL